ncbi:MAG: MBL fold metallo-hydrolase, partial [Oscillospiraceae bacterium]|nr:MBL fold metallo-hydrolase [Oscillospiraceae bacterium]
MADGDTISLGETTLRVLHTPGHTGGSCCFCTDNELFTGDTLFHGSMGRTDFPTGNPSDMMASLRRLSALEGDFTVYPGHGPSSTLQWERDNNPYMRQEMGASGKTDDFVY